MPQLNAGDGIAIILNGPSSTGKTTIQKAIQRQAAENYLRVGIDTFFDELIVEPDLSRLEETGGFQQYTPSGEYIRGVEWKKDAEGNPVVPLTVGPAGDRIICGMHRAIAGYVDAGNHLVVDYILYKPSWREDLLAALEGRRVIFVKVHAPLNVIEQREKSRNTSPPGHARSHYHTVHEGMEYDLEIDTSLEDPDEAASKILDYIDSLI